MTKLSVNINKIATLRNSRGGNIPNVTQAAIDCVAFGAQGITVHPRPDERHITYNDVLDIAKVISVEFNIEGYPDARYFELVGKVKAAQATLVPDEIGQITSDHGWETIKNRDLLTDIVYRLKSMGSRVSVFVDADPKMVEGAANCGADRVELYTGPFAHQFKESPSKAIEAYIEASAMAKQCGLGLNAGHDLSLENLAYYVEKIPFTDEVSIGHALISDALYFGLHNTIQMYLREIESGLTNTKN